MTYPRSSTTGAPILTEDQKRAMVGNLYKYALHSKVLVVARIGHIGDWAAYCMPVPGFDHEMEMAEVAQHGVKVPQAMAELLFPWIAENFKWRR